MTNNLTPYPGAHERHLLRKSNNPLFGSPNITSEDLEHARLADQNELIGFTIEVQRVVMQCLQLGETTDSDVILELKEQLDKLYERSCGLAGDRHHEQNAIQSVIAPIMKAIEKYTGADPKAMQKLSDEKTAREIHVRFLNNKLVCDLLRPDSTIGPTELTATLLSEPCELMTPVLDFFDASQLNQLVLQGRELIKTTQLSADHPAQRNLAAIEQHLIQGRCW